jgi:radical SAM protein with 4Fe4S-binding SPASM domain
MDQYGFARSPEISEKVQYGRFRNVYLYITEKCQLSCGHCYMGERLEHAVTMPFPEVVTTLTTWRKMGGSKLTILGGEATLHPQFCEIIKVANRLGYEKVILTTNGLKPACKRLESLEAKDFAYVQVSLDGARPETHDKIRGKGTFNIAWKTIENLCSRGFDVRIICTVNKVNIGECLDLLPMADKVGVQLVKYHVFSGIGNGTENSEWIIHPIEWIGFYEQLEHEKNKWKTKIWYQPTYAKIEKAKQYAAKGYQGCIGRTLDRISIFPDGRAYVCSYLFDTSLNFANIIDGKIEINKGPNEFDLFTKAITHANCSDCKSSACMGGCPAEQIVMGRSSCESFSDIVPICRLWKSDLD